MNKEILIALMQKDLDELKQMFDGIEQMDVIPTSIASIAISKANNILSSIKELANGNSEIGKSSSDDLSMTSGKEEIKNISQSEDTSTPRLGVENVACKPQEYREDVNNILNISGHGDIKIEQEENTTSVDKSIAEEQSCQNLSDEVEKTQTIGEAQNVLPSLNEQMQRDDTTIGVTIGQQKVEDLASCMSLGDSFRYQRELFDNSGEKMMKALGDLNTLSNIEDAFKYVERFSWNMESSTVKEFMDLLHRRY